MAGNAFMALLGGGRLVALGRRCQVRLNLPSATAQKLMRHSDIRLTMNIYTHLDLADTAGAVAALPAI